MGGETMGKVKLFPIVAVLMCMLCICCTKTEYIETQKVVTEYKHSIDTLHDSIYHDVYHKEYIKGDTVFSVIKEYLYKDKFVSKIDTFVKVDSIPYYINRTIEKKAKLSWWQRIRLWLFYPMIVISVLSVLGFIYRRMF